jgi:predicted class III extradiol MEMO1 family dioxygenase
MATKPLLGFTLTKKVKVVPIIIGTIPDIL